LTPEHREVLRRSGLPDAIIDRLEDSKEPWVRSVSHDEGSYILGRPPGASGQRAGMGFAYRLPEDSHTRDYQIRRDQPDLRAQKNGTIREQGKYLFPPGGGQKLWFSPDFPATAFADTSFRLVIAEGVKKGLFCWYLATHSPAPRFVCVAIPGVYGFLSNNVAKTTNAKGRRVSVKGVIPDLTRFDLQGRTVIIIYDSDVFSNLDVSRARIRLTRELLQRGAQVRWVQIKDRDGHDFSCKVGFDDLAHLAGYGIDYALELIDKAINPQGSAGVSVPGLHHPYSRHDGALWRSVEDANGLVAEQRLTHFDAEVRVSIEADDGISVKRFFETDITVDGRVTSVSLSVDEFQNSAWPLLRSGPGAVTVPYQWPHVGPAILLNSNPRSVTRYLHVGWRIIGGYNVYLDADGAIGRDGRVPAIEMALGGRLRDVRLELARNEAELRAAIRALLEIRNVAVARISYVLLAVAVRAVLDPPPDYLVFLAGESGVFKTELTALLQRCWGRMFGRLHLVADWSGTANAIEQQLFLAKNMLTVIDDYPVVNNARQSADLQQKAERIVRSIGNQTGRARLNRQLEILPERPPRGSSITSGEDIPRGFSLAARLFAVDVGRKDVYADKLTILQKLGAEGLSALAMGEYVRWLAPDLTARTRAYQERVEKICGGLSVRGHRRTPRIQADLQAAAELFLKFAADRNAITGEELSEWAAACEKALADATGAAVVDRTELGPAARYLALIRSVLRSGRGHLIRDDGGAPDDAELCGWEWAGSGEHREMRPRGDRIGAVNTGSKEVFLDAELSLAAARRLAHEAGNDFEVSARTLNKRLHEDGRLVTIDAGTYLVRHSILGVRDRYLHLRLSDVVSDEDQPSTPGAARTSPQPPVRLEELADGEDERVIQ
jgi:hypothetical protein